MIRVNLHNYQPTQAEWAVIRRINALNLGLTYDLGIWNLWGSDEQHDRVEGCLDEALRAVNFPPVWANVKINLPVRYDDEDIPYDFPLRKGNNWTATVEIDTGQIINWPRDTGPQELQMKVVDEGVYTLYDSNGYFVVQIDDYVPHGLIPGRYGDYVHFKIDENGVITNWPKNPCFDEFIRKLEQDR